MTRRKWFQFSLRSFLLFVACAAMTPWILQHYRRWHSAHLWADLEAAKAERDQAQRIWYEAYTQLRSTGDAQAWTQEQAARQGYYKANGKLLPAVDRLNAFYGVSGVAGTKVVYKNGEKCLVPYE